MVCIMDILTRFERTRLISARSFQLSLGAPPLIKTEKGETMLDVAKRELLEKKIPLAVLRRFPSGEVNKINP
ncbi:MAG: DNA-directed RNA polymerase subunit K [Candidatus Diapherotrites archaeon CG10_big_fil_rev_8_21_14_0_10_31_34]|nr:MAG: DNA-directed RNA polymerase subunit K [Candidatus Diapherotrites archaeon CG10_big_fil_rev_8_21_14_0_10_31_34]PJA18246.1 MAG: DNA-directed RNA polymerase subunit K [Candidatus Diapherotrites archaeon CG_4_10_14_0_2_um_filter_31_5]